MSLQISDNFSYLGSKPLDSRLVFDTIAQMENFSASTLYIGCVSYNKETESLYIFNGISWDLFESGMPTAPVNISYEITAQGTNYQINDIVPTNLQGTFAKVKQITNSGGILEVESTESASSNTSGIGAYIKATRTFYVGSGTSWEELLVDDESIAVIPEYKQNTQYYQNELIRFGNIVGIIFSNYISDNTKPSIKESFDYDVSQNNILLIKGETQSVPECLGQTDNEDTLETEIIPSGKGNWVLITDCNNTAPGQAGIGLYNGTDWDILPIPKGDFNFPEPPANNKQYLRSVSSENNLGAWETLKEVSGNETTISIKTTSSLTLVPKAGEPIWFESTNMETNEKEYQLLVGNGTSTIAQLQPFYGDKYTSEDILNMIGYTPEDASKRGAANGYAPLNENGIIPNSYLPTNLIDTYSKTEIDTLDQTLSDNLTLLINQEVSRATGAENNNSTIINTHILDNTVHVTQDEKDLWNAKTDSADLLPYENHISDNSIHVSQEEKDKWNGMNKAYFVTSVDLLPTENNNIGNIGYVRTSAEGIVPMVCEEYLWTGTSWESVDSEGVSIELNWNNIVDKPAATPLTIDNVVTIAHSHNNKAILDKIGQTAAGNFTFNNIEIGIRVIFVETEMLLPDIGAEDTLYVVYKDSRTRNYPSISVYKDDSYQILGKGAQENAPVVGDMQILQMEFYNAQANSEHIITYGTPNQFFCFLPVEILVEIAGLTNQSRDILNINSTSDNIYYNEKLLSVNDNGCYIDIKPLDLILDTVSNNYFSHVDINTNDYKNMQGLT